MEHFGTKKNSAIRKRVKKAHSKAGFAGTLYLLGALAIAVLVPKSSRSTASKRSISAPFWAAAQEAVSAPGATA